MKFLVLALCVYSASAAVPGYRGFAQPWEATAQAVAQVGGATVGVLAPAAKTVLTGNKDADASVLRYDFDVTAEGFNYGYETGNGIVGSAKGYLKNVDNTAALVVEGIYKYIDANGEVAELTYIADENGFQPRSNLIPVAPPVPEAILRSIQFNEAHSQPRDDIKNYRA